MINYRNDFKDWQDNKVMFWPGMGDPVKRKKTIRYLLITAAIGLVAFLSASLIQGKIAEGDPLKTCIENRITPFKIKANLEIYIDGLKTDIPANIGIKEDGCQRSLYTLTNDGTIYAEWEEEYPFEIGHFLWAWEFPLNEMDQSKSRILVDGLESELFIHALLEDGHVYRGEFVTKGDKSEETDFAPPQ